MCATWLSECCMISGHQRQGWMRTPGPFVCPCLSVSLRCSCYSIFPSFALRPWLSSPTSPLCALSPYLYVSHSLLLSLSVSLSLPHSIYLSFSPPTISLYLSLPLSLSQVQRWFLLLCVSQLLSRAPYCTVSLQVVAKSLIFCECQPYVLSLKGLNGMGK